MIEAPSDQSERVSPEKSAEKTYEGKKIMQRFFFHCPVKIQINKLSTVEKSSCQRFVQLASLGPLDQ